MTRKAHPDPETLLALRHGGADAREKLAGIVAADPEAAALIAEWDRQDAMLRTLYDPIASEAVPERLLAETRMAANRPSPPWRGWRALAAAVALLVIGTGGGWFAAGMMAPSSDELTRVARAAHATYAVEKLHPVEVRANELPHLRTWLANRSGLPLAVPRLDELGFTLVGGRILPLGANGQSAAMLMYEDGAGRRVSLVVARAEDGEETGFRYGRGSGVELVWWTDPPYRCVVIGDVPREVLTGLAQSAYAQLIGA